MPNKRSGGGLSPTQQAAKFLGVSVLAGAVMAGIALPAVGALGLAAKGSVEGFDELPANLKQPPLSQRTTILDSKGDSIATVYSRDRTVVDLKEISPYMQQAIIAIEDARFYQHGAVDLKGVLRAVNRNAQEGGVAQGASTLTQQLVKNVAVEEAGDDPTLVAQAIQQTLGRKIRELKYAIQLEEELGKKKILENYLNITFFGQQAYGVEAASQRYFSKSAKDLKVEEAALLAGIVQSPSRYDPVNDPQEATKRRNTVLQRMADLGDISRAEADKAKEKPLGLDISRPKNGCITAVKGAGFFCDYVREVFLNDPIFGKSKEARAKIWNQGGLTIRTTMDPKAQKSVQASVKEHVRQKDEVATAATIVEPGTGNILAMGQSRPYGLDTKKNETSINLSVDESMGGGAGYQPGSTFKPIVAAAAIEGGMSPGKIYPAPYQMLYPSPISTCGGGNWRNSTGSDAAKLENESASEVGPYSMEKATALSVNTYFVQMIADIGICPVTEMAGKMGVERADGRKMDQAPSIALGTQEMSPLTMANAYATFASRGMYCTPVAIESITQRVGEKSKSLEVPKSTCSRAMSEKTADTISTLLEGVVEDGTGTEAGLGPSRPSAGKTGTTDYRYAAWFVGYTPNMAGAVWVGDPAHKRRMVNITIGGVGYDKVFGGKVPGPIWRDMMSGALEGKPSLDFNHVFIPDERPDRDRDRGDDDNGNNNNDNDDDNGNGDDGDNDDGFFGGTDGGTTFPTPEFSIPENWIQGQTNGGNNGNGNGGGFG
ncbi:transglycosylase domain-containing protein [Streptomyces europaeiscabiei]|uniref:transglycosylase domain-containing protein n=1 Tax=Streptomyces europaeiscabiei TaxID=146819 RepID=UPI000ADBB2F4|nr:transglycosylase domain-containing protein [Streptomyces europaeiscabiei]MDX2530465.1 transglycosylase domain-containing protein [Streptomyces europaeiscabiei]MDX3668303.1 transglycosylase domain-containing protein [Streptomyces europaeiscabiei]MDX3708840.1 transglycosylase domain-containing protein [Streptomyces europaeiscabiei]MDX3777695.1 transglycosylase domain-containing protein [Streptomyces europaeiscabiei]